MPAYHILPAHYLKGFTETNSKKLWMYFLSGKQPRNAIPKNVGKENDYWDKNTEHIITENVERPAQATLDKIRSHAIAFDYRERWALAMYMVMMARRVKNEREKALAQSPITIEEFKQDFAERVENFIREQPGDENEIRRAALDRTVFSDEYFSNLAQQVWARSLRPDYSIDVVQTVASMSWIFFVANGERKFLTTDHPLVRTRTGIKPPDGEILFPVSSEIALWGTWQYEGNIYMNVEQSLVDDVNRWLVSEMRQYAFYPSKEEWVVNLLREEYQRRNVG